MKYNLVEKSDSILTIPTKPFMFDGSIDPEELASDMLAIMESKRGIGLAANQIGLPYSVFVIHGDPYACFNPKIVDVSEDQVITEEGCLTFPGLYVKVKRPRSVRLRYTNIKGVTETQRFDGTTARVIQHEMEHLNGELFFNSASKFHKDQAFRAWKTYLRHPERFTVKK